ncbi:MAG TPA: sensor histidine kinase [Limnobacter sp.]|nr:sensor histidine kinase [Limnobacter sp.]
MSALRNRLSGGLAASLLVLLCAQWWFSSQAIENLLITQMQDQLERDSEVLLAGAEHNTAGVLMLNDSRLMPAYQQPFSGFYYALQHEQNTVYSRSLWDASLSISPPMGTAASLVRQPGPDGQQLLIHVRRYTKDSQSYTIAIARDITSLQDNLIRYKLANAGFSALFMLALLLIQRWIVIHSLRPLNTIQSTLIRLQQGEISRLEVDGPDEIKPLIDELNRLLLAIEHRLKRSREGMGNLAHALKTRLARLDQLSEAAHAPAFSAEVQSLGQEVARLIDRETARVRVVGSLRPGQRINLADIVHALVRSCQALYRSKGLTFDLNIPAKLHVLADREDLFELLGNLIDNAAKWADTRVYIGMEGNMLTVQDDGPGCPESTLAALTQRGFRADESTPGSGLGLAIAQDIADSYGATLHFANASPGLLVVLTFKPGSVF